MFPLFITLEKWVGMSIGYDHRFLLNSNTTLTFSIQGGIATSYDDYNLSVQDRAYIGSSSLRGFEFGGVGPADSNGSQTTFLGGRKFLAGSIQIDHHLAKYSRGSLSAFGFYDFGSLVPSVVIFR